MEEKTRIYKGLRLVGELRTGKLVLFTDKMIKKERWNTEGNTNVMWRNISTCIQKVAKEVV